MVFYGRNGKNGWKVEFNILLNSASFLELDYLASIVKVLEHVIFCILRVVDQWDCIFMCLPEEQS